MGAAAAPIAAGSAIASAGLSAYGSILKGKAEEAAATYKAERLERSAKIGRVAAEETDVQMTENLNIQLGNIDATRAAMHDDPTSPTGAAVRDYASRVGLRARTIAVENILSQAEQDEADAAYLRQAGKFANKMGQLGAVAALLKAGSSTDWSSFGGSGGSGGQIGASSVKMPGVS